MIKSVMKRYDAYKDSGVEWLGEVPEHWEVNFLVKVLSSLVDYRGRTPKKVNPDENGMFLVTARNIKKGCIDYSLSKEFVDIDDVQSLLNRGKPKIGDVLFTTEAPLGEVANVDREDFALAQRIIKFRGKRNSLNNYFMKYWLVSSVFQNTLQRNATGSTALGLKGSKVRLLNIVLPKLPEQTAIAAYLNTKTAQIDRKIDLLTQKAIQYGKLKQSLINETVTRGLDKTVAMKDSGVEWIGEVPEHWEIKRVKDELENLDYKRMPLSGEVRGQMTEQVFDYYGASGVIDKVESYIFDEPLILIGEDGANLLMRNSPLAFIARGKYWVNNHAHILRPKKGSLHFLCYLLEAFDYTILISGSAQPKLTAGNLNSVLLMIPPISEQQAIADYLDTKTAHIDNIVTTINTQIDKLKELRKTLINDVVTGKIKVV